MENSVQITYRNQVYEVKASLTLVEALEALGIDPERVLAIRKGEMIGGDCRLEAGDAVRLVGVISGGGTSPLSSFVPPFVPQGKLRTGFSQRERGNSYSDLTPDPSPKRRGENTELQIQPGHWRERGNALALGPTLALSHRARG